MKSESDIGIVGLGVMGRNLALNFADHGFSIVGYDRDEQKVESLEQEAGQRQIHGVKNVEAFVGSLKKPRAALMLVPAGSAVDSVIESLLPYLEPGDLIIDGGNSYFKDTDIRADALAAKDIQYLGVGISGGESGARHGPSMMAGGSKQAYQRISAILEAAAARVADEPCVAYLGPGSAGHYVKMVHNGIEYGFMQLIAETYDLMKRGLGLSDDEISTVFRSWNRTELNSYLIEISGDIFAAVDSDTGKHLVDVILDEAKQKGTGKWTSQDAMDLQVPVPTIDIAVAMRNLSIYKTQRQAVNERDPVEIGTYKGDKDEFLVHLKNALYAALIITFAQGMSQLRSASQKYDYELNLETVARIWRGGCIIRARLLEKIRAAYAVQKDLPNLLLNSSLDEDVRSRSDDLRMVVSAATGLAIPTPALAVSLGYFYADHSAWLPANLIQAQRDYFGAHTYERIDEKGSFHMEWGHKE